MGIDTFLEYQSVESFKSIVLSQYLWWCNEINWNEDESGEKKISERENLDDESDAEKNNSNEQQEERIEEVQYTLMS